MHDTATTYCKAPGNILSQKRIILMEKIRSDKQLSFVILKLILSTTNNEYHPMKHILITPKRIITYNYINFRASAALKTARIIELLLLLRYAHNLLYIGINIK